MAVFLRFCAHSPVSLNASGQVVDKQGFGPKRVRINRRRVRINRPSVPCSVSLGLQWLALRGCVVRQIPCKDGEKVECVASISRLGRVSCRILSRVYLRGPGLGQVSPPFPYHHLSLLLN